MNRRAVVGMATWSTPFRKIVFHSPAALRCAALRCAKLMFRPRPMRAERKAEIRRTVYHYHCQLVKNLKPKKITFASPDSDP